MRHLEVVLQEREAVLKQKEIELDRAVEEVDAKRKVFPLSCVVLCCDGHVQRASLQPFGCK